MFDLYILPLHLKHGQDVGTLPGLLVAQPPRRAHRNRAQETLIIHLAVVGGNPLPLVHEEWLKLTAATYFATRGLATAAMRTAAEHLNQVILDHNLKGANAENRLNLALNMAVLRGRLLYLGQSGGATAMHLTRGEVATLPELQTDLRLLGTSRAIELRYNPLEITPGAILLTGAKLPAGWNQQTLADTSNLPLEQARRRLLLQGGSDLTAQFIQFQPGKGVIHRLKPRLRPGTEAAPPPAADAAAPLEATPPAPVQIPEPAPLPAEEAEPALPVVPPFIEETPPAKAPEAPPARPETWRAPVPEATARGGEPRRPTMTAQPTPPAQATTPSEPAVTPPERRAADEPERVPVRPSRPAAQRPPRPAKKITLPKLPQAPKLPKLPPELLLQLSHAWHNVKAAFGKAGVAIKRFLPRMLPEGETISLTPGAMLFIALAVPVLVVAVATTVYFRTGRSELHLQYLGEAAASAAQASEAGDPALQRVAWQQAMTWLVEAERYGQTEESRLLREQVTGALDQLNSISRLYFQPAIAVGFDKSLHFTNIATTDSEIFLLESGQSRIYRLFLTGTGYQLDPDFNCNASALPKTTVIGSLVDLVAIPPNALNASVMAVDAAGTLMYCGTGIQPALQYLPTPDTGWGAISAMALNAGGLYLLDAPANAVWSINYGTTGLGEHVRLFFDDEVPQMDDMIDLAVYAENLYLLHADGRMAACLNRTFTLGKATCSDPASFGDQRQGQPPEVLLFPDTRFIQLATTAPPDPSVYALDAASNSMYHFSLRLNLQRLLQPQDSADYPIPEKPLTAFAITSGRIVVFAFENEVYLAEMP
ncbi:MAG: hypothetical protein HPY76_02640 [Anaerolineae bacterium]|nr:hypothetical protein [Anaerolineae bacterium]